MTNDATNHATAGNVCKSCLLTESEIGAVTVCADCGVVTLSLQYIAMRFQPDAFHELTRLLNEANANLHRLAEATLLTSGQSNAAEQFGGTWTKPH